MMGVSSVDFLQALAIGEYDDAPTRPFLHLLGTPHVTVGDRRIDIPESGKRLLAFLAIRRACVERRYAAGLLWPSRDDARAAGSLRTALWRLNGAHLTLVTADKHALQLSQEAAVDLHLVSGWAARIMKEHPHPADLLPPPRDMDFFDLLPGCYEEWALMERERFRHRIFHGLEALSAHLARAGRYAQAVETALTVVTADPLRESAQRVLIEAHVAEGNLMEARRSYSAYQELLWEELRVQPAPDLLGLALSCRGRQRSAPRRRTHSA